MKSMFIFLILLLSCSLFPEMLNYDKVLTNLKGVKYYNNEEFQESENYFNENSINYPREGKLHFNQGNALYKTGKLEEAENEYNMAFRDDDFKEKSVLYQNLGNIKFQQQDFKNALKHYRNALIENPDNEDARFNYELASRYLQQQQQQQQQQNQDDKNKEEKKEKQKSQEEKKEQEQKQDQQQQKQKDEEEQKTEKQKQEQMKKDKKKEDAEKMLKALLQKEKEEMKKEKQKLNVDKSKSGKYW
jgi:tetratricopeptide (TPR) repeat protein